MKAARTRRLEALFFVVILPGNVAHWVHQRDGFALGSDEKRFAAFLRPTPRPWAPRPYARARTAVSAVTAAAADQACGRQAAGYGVGTSVSERGSPLCSSGTR